MAELLVRELLADDCGQIAELFCTDNILRSELGFLESDQPTAKEVADKYQAWCRSRSAVPYAVVLNQTTTIGCICLSRIDAKSEPARIAGWIASSHRGRGYGQAAIERVKAIALAQGLPNLNILGIEND